MKYISHDYAGATRGALRRFDIDESTVDARRTLEEHAEGMNPLLAEGTRVGDFRIRGLLGEGAMGQVYLAQDLTLGRHVALKLIKP